MPFQLNPCEAIISYSDNVHNIPIFNVKHSKAFSIALSFLLRSLNEIKWIQAFAVLKAYLYLEKIFFIS